ncbi:MULTISPECIES: DUF952 domain-containing protein [Salinibaculum]|uniref:DUF952 domain-containing protein n=1 Tax=Salinibaculum TaxID=2732368 RepID=UPI0030D1DD53
MLEGDADPTGDSPYRDPSLDSEGFIHCSTPAQVVTIAQTLYADAEDLRLLVVDPDRLDAPVKYEEMPQGGYAHVYGPINAEAIADVVPFPTEDGRYVLPEELQ